MRELTTQRIQSLADDIREATGEMQPVERIVAVASALGVLVGKGARCPQEVGLILTSTQAATRDIAWIEFNSDRQAGRA